MSLRAAGWLPKRPDVLLWDHNAHFHDYLLERLPARMPRALDVGCGTGTFTRLLAQRAGHVDGIDASPAMIAAAQAASAPGSTVRWILGDVISADLEPGSYDAVTAIASLHHLPLEPGLRRLAALVRPGGTLAIVGLARAATLADYAIGAATIVLDPGVGAWKALRGNPSRVALGTEPMPVRDPEVTTVDIADAADRLLPGAVLRRHLFYRYTLLWRRAPVLTF